MVRKINISGSSKTSCFFTVFSILLSVVIITGVITGFILYTKRHERPKGAIVTNGIECAAMGRKIFELGGNVADVAVTTVLCEGVTCPQSSGIGGGFLLTIYLKDLQLFRTLNARERAPREAREDMFKSASSTKGGLAVAVPGELKGLWELHKQYGNLKWKDLVKPVIELCRRGHLVSPYLENIFKTSKEDLINEPTLREIFINPITNSTYAQGKRIKRLKLAKTLEIVAREGADALYGGELGRKMVVDVKARGGILSEQDLKDYDVVWSTTLSTSFLNNNTVHTFPLPSSGACLIFMLNLLDDYNLKDTPLTYHRIIEAFKLAYAKRTFLGDAYDRPEVRDMMRNLVDPEYADEIRELINDHKTYQNISHYGPFYGGLEDQGTAHISILAPNGDAISVTSTINYKLGAFFRSRSTGIIMNNEMDDFAVPDKVNVYGIPPSPANFIRPGRHPLSSMVPSIVVDEKGDVRMVIGAAGGSKIPTSVFTAIFRHFYLNETLADAISARRLHHQLTPPQLQWETNFDGEILRELSESFGHELKENKPDGGFAAVTGVSVVDGQIQASYDPRRGGAIEVF